MPSTTQPPIDPSNKSIFLSHDHADFLLEQHVTWQSQFAIHVGTTGAGVERLRHFNENKESERNNNEDMRLQLVGTLVAEEAVDAFDLAHGVPEEGVGKADSLHAQTDHGYGKDSLGYRAGPRPPGEIQVAVDRSERRCSSLFGPAR